MVDKTFSSVQDVINFGLVPIEEGKENVVVDGCRAIQRGHAPGQEGTLKEKTNKFIIYVFVILPLKRNAVNSSKYSDPKITHHSNWAPAYFQQR